MTSLGYHDHLLQAQAFIPPTELVEVAGFTGTSGTDLSPRFEVFDNGKGLPVPLPDESGFRNHPIRMEVIEILNATPGYRLVFGKVFPEVKRGAPITFDMFGKAIAEFEFTLTFATAPIDRFARGQQNAMTDAEKRGALVFFGEGKCITCHATKGKSNEMFSDFENHVAGIPQLAPRFGEHTSNMIYDGPARTRISARCRSRAIPRTSTSSARRRSGTSRSRRRSSTTARSRGWKTRFASTSIRRSPTTRPRPGIDRDLRRRMGPRIDESYLHPLFRNGGIELSESQIRDVTQFVKTGLLDPRAKKENLCNLVPKLVPSRLKVLTFEACEDRPRRDN